MFSKMKHFVKYFMYDDKKLDEKKTNDIILKPCEKYYKNLKRCLDLNDSINKCDLQQLILKLCLAKN
jgi:hypothetical protein